jgi:hypothetical protein
MIKKVIIFYIFLVLCLVPSLILTIAKEKDNIENFENNSNLEEETIKVEKTDEEILHEEFAEKIKENFKNNNPKTGKLFIGVGITLILISIFYFIKIFIDNKFRLLINFENLYICISLVIGVLTCALLPKINSKGSDIALTIFSILLLVSPILIYVRDIILEEQNSETLVFIPLLWLILIIIYIKFKYSKTYEPLDIPDKNIIITKDNGKYKFKLNRRKIDINCNTDIDKIDMEILNMEKPPKFEVLGKDLYRIEFGNNEEYQISYRDHIRKPIKIVYKNDNEKEKFYLKKDNETDTYVFKNQENLELMKVSFQKNKIHIMFEGLTYNFILGCIISIILLEEIKRQNDIDIDKYYANNDNNDK